MKHGGKRLNAGRPNGSKATHTIQAQALKERLIERVLDEQEPIINALIKQAKKGQIPALREVFERVLGRVKTNIEIERNEQGNAFVLSAERERELEELLMKNG